LQDPPIAYVEAQICEGKYILLFDDVVVKKAFGKKFIIYVCSHFPPFASAVPFYDGRLSRFAETKLEKETRKFHEV